MSKSWRWTNSRESRAETDWECLGESNVSFRPRVPRLWGERRQHEARRVMARLGIRDASHHTLRHTGASFMLADGISVRVVQEIGGWTSLRMLERYTHPTDAEKRRAVESATRLTRVGTKTGTAVRSRNRRTRCASQKSLTGSQLEWRPQRDSNPCLSLERAIS